MKRIIFLTAILFLSLPVLARADSQEVEQLKLQVEIFEDVIASLEERIEELRQENEDLKEMLAGDMPTHEGIIDIEDVTEIKFDTDVGQYSIEEMFILPEGQPDSVYQNKPALLVLYEVTVKEDDFQSNNLFIYDIYTYQEFDVSYKLLDRDTIQFSLTDYNEYFKHNFEIIKKGATIKNAALFILEDMESPVIFEKDDFGYKIDLNNIEVKEKRERSRRNR